MSGVVRIHRDTFPKTDHGYTWIETYWLEIGGDVASPLSPGGGCTERLGKMPGDPIRNGYAQDVAEWVSELGDVAVRHSETVHGNRFYRVGSFSIVPETQNA